MNNQALLAVIAKLLVAGEIPASTLANWLVGVELERPLPLEDQQVLNAWIDDPDNALVEAQRDLLRRSLQLDSAQAASQMDHAGPLSIASASTSIQKNEIKSNNSNVLQKKWWNDLPPSPASVDFAPLAEKELHIVDDPIGTQELRSILTVLAEDNPQQDAEGDVTDEAGAIQDLDPLSFHLSLSQWIDDERVQSASSIDPKNIWDYDFWKADLISRDPLDERRRSQLNSTSEEPNDGHYYAYTVDVFFGEEDKPRRYQYWVELDDQGQALRSDWIDQSPAPDNKGKAFSDWSGRKRSSAILDADLLREIYLKSVREQEPE